MWPTAACSCLRGDTGPARPPGTRGLWGTHGELLLLLLLLCWWLSLWLWLLLGGTEGGGGRFYECEVCMPCWQQSGMITTVYSHADTHATQAGGREGFICKADVKMADGDALKCDTTQCA